MPTDIREFPEVYRRIKRAVAQEAPHLVPQLDEKLAAYPGTVGALSQLLLLYGSNNPWTAAQKLRLKRAVFRKRSELDEEVLGTSISGHKLKSQLFVFGHPYDPTREVYSGVEAILSFMQAFGTPEQAALLTEDSKRRRAETASRLNKKLDEAINDILTDPFERMYNTLKDYFAPLSELKNELKARLSRPFTKLSDVLSDVLPRSYTPERIVQTLEEVLRDPSRLKDVQSTLDRLRVHYILGVNDELKRCIGMLDRLAHTDTAYQDAENMNYRALIALEPGGGVMSWLEKKIRNEENSVPREMRDIFSTLQNPAAPIDEQEWKFMYAAVLAYAAKERLVDRDAAIGGHLQDLHVLETLPEDHPLIKKYGLVNRAAIRDLEAQNKITLIDATRVFDIYPIDEVRREMNSAYLRQNEAEAERILLQLEPLFMKRREQDAAEWLPDATGSSVPMERLKGTLYYLTFRREDFRAAQEMLKLQTVTRTDERLCAAVPLAEFRERVDALVVMARKLEYMNRELVSRGVLLAPADDVAPIARQWQETLKNDATRRNSVPEFQTVWAYRLKDAPDVFAQRFVEHWKLALFRGGEYQRKEAFADAYGIALDEALDRLEALRRYENEWKKQGGALKTEAAHGLYSTKRAAGLETLIEQVKKYAPYDEAMNARVESARQTANHPMVVWSSHRLPREGGRYVSPEERETLTDYERAAAEIAGAETGAVREKISELIERREILNQVSLINGTAGTCIELAEVPYTQIEEPKKAFGRNVQLVDVDRLESHLTVLEEEYSPIEELGVEWFRRAQYLASFDAEKLLRRANVTPSSGRHFAAVKALEKKGTRVSVHLAEQVDALYERLAHAEPKTQPAKEVMLSGADELAQGELYDRYIVTARGTTRADAGRFRREIGKLQWTGSTWQGMMNSGEARIVTQEIERYNHQYGAQIRVMVQKRD